MPSKDRVTELKRRHGRRLLRMPGVSGVGIERSDDDAYVLVVHLKHDDEETRAAVQKELAGAPARIVRSGRFKKY